jgi:hypothetical protein
MDTFGSNFSDNVDMTGIGLNYDANNFAGNVSQGQTGSGVASAAIGGAAQVATAALTAANPAAMAAKAVGGVVKAVGSLFGGGKRRREQRQARQELARRKADFESTDTSNPYKNLTNTYENLTVNTQAADFAAQQSSQGAANIMGNLAAAAGGGGIAALAQSLANSQAQAAQQASASIAQQEQRNAMLSAQGEASRQKAVATGERQSQVMEYKKQSTLLGMAQQRKAAADQARKDATNALVSGIGDIAGGLAGGGGFAKGGLKNMFGG